MCIQNDELCIEIDEFCSPGTWHNGVYIAKEHSPATFLTRQGRVHGRVSASWAYEFNTICKVPLSL